MRSLLFCAVLVFAFYCAESKALGDDLRADVDFIVDESVQEVEVEVKKLMGELRQPIFDGPTKEELLLKLAQLLLNSKTVQDFLQKEGKPLLAKGLQKIDDILHDLDAKVRQADPKTEVGKIALKGLEDLIGKAEKDLEAEIKKINDEIHTPPVNGQALDVIEDVLKTGEMLLSKAKQLVEELKAKGHTVEAEALAVLEDGVIDAMQALKNYHPITGIDKLVQQGLIDTLKFAEDKLDQYIQKLVPPVNGGDVIADLLQTGEMLLSKAKQFVDELKAKGRTVEAEALALLEDGVIDAMQKLKEYHPLTPLDKLVQKGLEDALKFAEDKLDDFIQKLIPPVNGGDVITDLLTTGEMLVKKAEQFIAELKAKGHSVEADALAVLENGVIDAMQALKNYHPITGIDKLVQQGLIDALKFAENKLDQYIQKLVPPGVMAQLSKEELLLKIAELLLNSKTVQDFLQKEGKPLLAKGLQKLDDILHDLDAKVRKADPKTDIGKLALKGLEDLIGKAEKDLEAEIKKINDEIHKPPVHVLAKRDIPDLLKTGEMLLQKAKQFIDELRAKGRGVEADALALLEDGVIDAMQKLKEYHPKTDVGRLIQKGLEDALKWAENKLDNYIQKLIQESTI